MFLNKLPSYQIAQLLSSKKLYLDNLVVYYRDSQSFLYQVIFSKKAKIGVVKKNQIKRQIRQVLSVLQYAQLRQSLLILVKSKALNNQELKIELSNLRNQLIAQK